MPKEFQSKDIEDYISSSDTQNDGSVRALMTGASGAGKTFAAASLSEKWVYKDGKPQPATLDDIVYIPFDPGAVRGLAQFGVKIPQTIDFLQIYRDKKQDLLAATQVIRQLIYKKIDGGYTRIIADSLSTYDQLLELYWASKGKEKWDLFGAMKRSHSMLARTLLYEPGVDVVLCCHVKDFNPGDDVKVEARMSATVSTGSIDYVPDITGQSLKFYVRPMDICPFLETQYPKNKPPIRKLYTAGGAGMTKNRWQEVLNNVEEPNLRTIFDKIRATK